MVQADEHDEDPAPTTVATQTIQLSQSICQQTAKGTRQNRSAEEQIQTPLELVAFIVHRDEVHTARKESCFEEAKQQSHGYQAGLVLDQTLPDSTNAPEEHDGGEPSGWGHLLENDVAWDLLPPRAISDDSAGVR